MSVRPSRGEVWDVDLDPVEGHEQAGRRPCVVISNDSLNHSPSELAIIVPLTRTRRATRVHIPIAPPAGGVTSESFIMCDQIRAVSTERFVRKRGTVVQEILADIEDRITVLLGFE